MKKLIRSSSLRIRIGPYFLSAAFIPLLFASKVKARYNNQNIQPQIINTSSMNGWTKDPATGGHCYPYLLSKAAIGHLTSLLAHDFIPLGIRVNQIAPGWVVTGMSAPGTVDEYGVSSKQGEFFASLQRCPFSRCISTNTVIDRTFNRVFRV